MSSTTILIIGVSVLTLAIIGAVALFKSIRRRFALIKDAKKYITDSKRVALFGDWERAAVKLRIAARISPVPIENLGLDEPTLHWVQQAARLNLRDSEGKSFYV